MAIYTNLPIYEECYQLMLQLVVVTQKMQRDFRYTIGERLKQVVMDMIVLIYKANKAEDKLRHIAEAREKLVEAKVMLRVLNDVKQLSDRQFVLFAERTTSISKQFAAWENYQTKNKTKEDGR